MTGAPPPPWEGKDTMLARAFSAAMERIKAATENTPIEPGSSMSLAQPSAHALMFSGLDVPTEEALDYFGALAANYLYRIDQRGSEIVRRADEAGEGRDEYLPRVRAAGHLLLRGLCATSALAGALYGVELERVSGVGKPLSPPSTGSTLAAETPEGRVPSIAERRELSRDSVQAVLDLEADRLDRMSITLAGLGIERAAHMMQAAAMVIRFELSGGMDPIPPGLAREHQRQREQLDANHQSQIESLKRWQAQDPVRAAEYLAHLDRLHQRQQQERDALDDE